MISHSLSRRQISFIHIYIYMYIYIYTYITLSTIYQNTTSGWKLREKLHNSAGLKTGPFRLRRRGMKSADENQIVWDLLEWGNLEALKILGLTYLGLPGKRHE